MQLDHYVNTLGKSLKLKYGIRVRKLSLDGGFSCPNRDGTIGRGGCTFCSVESFAESLEHSPTIAQQIDLRKRELKQREIKYLAYFQSYTNTHAEFGYLKNLYEQALKEKDIIGICIGTRPDCLSEAVLQLLHEFNQHGKEVWLELGLQTANDNTLKKINRGHDFYSYQQAVKAAKKYALNICCHLILGLPGETLTDYLHTHEQVLSCGVQGLKLHPLHVVKNSAMARSWRFGRLDLITQEQYVAAAVELIQRTPLEVCYHRVSAQARPGTLLAPIWCGNKWLPLVEITRQLDTLGGQGCKV
ncbi:hypothetical protein SAMN02745866_03545 [Alteromonadaceae bacterium Bs31]|nr:hypothetical protein SAMN02745866_03545 [Alteromonadaceae bacterium Bs31]